MLCRCYSHKLTEFYYGLHIITAFLITYFKLDK